MKADGSLKSLLQGVSQQPTRDRLPGQCTEQVNMSADPVKGLTRRPGDDLVGSLGSTTSLGWATLITQDGRQFICKITSAGPKIYDYNANEYSVTVTGDMSYWTTPGKFSIGTIKNDTYIANEGVVTQMRTDTRQYFNLGPVPKPSGIVQILGGNYGKTYSIFIDGVLAVSMHTVDGSDQSDSSYVGTSYIAAVLTWLLTNTYPGTALPGSFRVSNGALFQSAGNLAAAGWTITRADDVILLVAPTGHAVFTMTITDDASNINAKAMTSSVPDVADLPKFAPHDYVVKQASETDPDQDLWLRFVSDTVGATPGSNFGVSGAWYEAIAPGISTGFVNATMPRVMNYNPTTQTFTVGVQTFVDRTIGTETTNPTPSFIGYGISDITTFQSRLVFLAGPNLVASRTRKYTDFWVGSASTLVDSDPLDMSSQAAFATAFEFAVPHNKDLVIFSSRGQFVMFGRAAVTPKNAALVLTTSFEADLTAKPSPCGRNVFFATKYGRYAGLREFYTEGGTDINDTRPITQHVKNYIIGGAVHMSSTSNYDTLIVHTDADKNIVYPYQFIWNDQEKVQSAWSKWIFPADISYSFFDDELIYYVQRVGTTDYLLRMSLDVLPEGDLGFHVHLSNRFDVAGVDTQFVLPYDWLKDYPLTVVQGEDAPHPGLPVRITSIVYDAGEGGYVVTLREDMLAGNIVVGVKWMSDYWPTMPRMKDQQGVVISNARLVIDKFLIALEETGHISGQKMSKWGNGPEIPFEGYIVGATGTLVGRPALDDFTYQLPFNDKVENGEVHLFTDSHYPMTILDIEWEGTANKRGQRINSEGARQ